MSFVNGSGDTIFPNRKSGSTVGLDRIAVSKNSYIRYRREAGTKNVIKEVSTDGVDWKETDKWIFGS